MNKIINNKADEDMKLGFTLAEVEVSTELKETLLNTSSSQEASKKREEITVLLVLFGPPAPPSKANEAKITPVRLSVSRKRVLVTLIINLKCLKIG